jgi:hypothetical protein
MPLLDRCDKLGTEAAAIARIVQLSVQDPDASGLELVAEVAHRTEEHGNARLGAPHVFRLVADLGHPHGIHGGVETIKGGRAAVELVTKQQD